MLNRRALIVLIFSAILVITGPALASMIPLPPSTLIDYSDQVVHGFVTETACRPAAKEGDIETVVRIYTAQQIKGESPEYLDVVVPGGIIGERFHFVTDTPYFETGQEVVVFLDATGARVVGQIQGKLTIEKGVVRELLESADDVLNSLKDQVAGIEPLLNLDLPVAGTSYMQGALENGIVPLFRYDGYRWPSNSTRAYINNNAQDVTDGDQAIRRSMQSWNDVKADFEFKFAGSTTRAFAEINGTNDIFWSDTDEFPGAIAYVSIWGDSRYIVECDMTILEEYSWSTKDDPHGYEMDVQNIVTHELGHFLSLSDLYDPGDAGATMYGYAGNGETNKRSLEKDDKDGIISIYGPGPGADNSPDTPDQIDDGLTSDTCEKIISSIYETCQYAILANGGSTFSEEKAMDECDFGSTSTSWECIGECWSDADSCAAMNNCIENSCGTSLVEDRDPEDDDGGGGLCG